MSLSLYQVDAFTNAPFSGNPAAVCLLPTARDAEWMQDVAAEMNLSETAFLQPQRDAPYRLRWFTPSDEVDLCGHATLASAHVLWSEGYLAPDETARFDTKSGLLSATRSDGWIRMDFPADPPTPVEPPPRLLDGLGVLDPIYVGRTERDYFLHCADEETVRGLAPDMATLAALDTRGVIVTAPRKGNGVAPSEGAEVDFVSRFFAPAVGVPEDPVTGSAHCALGPYWSERTGQTALMGRQLSDRGGTVRVRLPSPGDSGDRVGLSGQAAMVFHARLEA